MVETVKGKLDYTANVQSSYLDVVLQKEVANTEAHADLVLEDGTVLAKGVPATVLLGLEKKFAEIRKAYEAIPTLSPGDDWKPDSKTGHFSTERNTVKFKKVFKNHVRAEATDKHPAQVETYQEDERLGLFLTKKETSVLTSLEKSQLLTRVDLVIQAAKTARQRANNQEVKSVHIGATLFDYINSSKKPAKALEIKSLE